MIYKWSSKIFKYRFHKPSALKAIRQPKFVPNHSVKAIIYTAISNNVRPVQIRMKFAAASH